MAPTEVIAPVAESPHGLAFEVNIKSPDRERVMTPARARLEAYGADGLGPLPCLLHSNRLSRQPLVELHDSKDRMAKARKQNQQVRDVLSRIREEHDRSANVKRIGLEQELKNAAEKREGELARRSAQAGKHFQAARAKSEEHHQQCVATAKALQHQLEELQAQKTALRNEGLAERCAHACQHNEAVAERVQRSHQACQAEELRGLVQCLARAAEKREGALADRSARAGRHFEEAIAKSEACHQRQLESAAARRRHLEGALAHHLALRGANLAERSARAGQHNGAVACKAQHHLEEVLRRAEELRGETPAERFMLLALRAYDRHQSLCLQCL